MNSETKYLLDSYHLSDDVNWNQIDTLIPRYQLVNHIDYFLSHLKDDHELPGKIYDKLQGIGHWIREHENEIITQKQLRYATLAMIGYWHEVKDEYRHYF